MTRKIVIKGDSMSLSEVEDLVDEMGKELDALEKRADILSEAMEDEKEYQERVGMGNDEERVYSNVCELERRLAGMRMRLSDEHE